MAALQAVGALFASLALFGLAGVIWHDGRSTWAYSELNNPEKYESRRLNVLDVFGPACLVVGLLAILAGLYSLVATVDILASRGWLDSLLAQGLAYQLAAAFFWLVAACLYGHLWDGKGSLHPKFGFALACLVASGIEIYSLWSLFDWNLAGGLFVFALLVEGLAFALVLHRNKETSGSTERSFSAAVVVLALLCAGLAFTACCVFGGFSGIVVGSITFVLAVVLAVTAFLLPFVLSHVLEEAY